MREEVVRISGARRALMLQHLAINEQFILRAQTLVRAQRLRVAQCVKLGVDVTAAQKLLDSFERYLEICYEIDARLRQWLSRGTTPSVHLLLSDREFSTPT